MQAHFALSFLSIEFGQFLIGGSSCIGSFVPEGRVGTYGIIEACDFVMLRSECRLGVHILVRILLIRL